MAWAELAKAIFVEAIPALVDLIKSAIDAGEDEAQKLRDQPITISISFGGGEGEAVKYQRTIEAKLPNGFDPFADETPTVPDKPTG